MKNIVILGGGESGVGTAILAQKQGFNVFLSDRGTLKDKYRQELLTHHIPFEEGQHTKERILEASEVIKSPGIPDTVPLIISLKDHHIPVISEIEFAARYTKAQTICITGSNGKTTTTMLTYFILKKAGLNVGIAGNVGTSFARQVAEENFDYYVLELSSFQLDGMFQFKADVSIVLNITPDHLDRYDHKFQNYVDAKFRILQNQTPEEAFIYWNADPIIQEELEKHQTLPELFGFGFKQDSKTKAYIEQKELVMTNGNQTWKMPLEELALKGTHNIYNSMAAGLAAQIMDIKKDKIREALAAFDGVEHRLESVATVRGTRYINDSKATNVNSCWYALQSMHQPTILILGGKDKGNNYDEIIQLVKEKVHTLIFLGADNTVLENYFNTNAPEIKHYDAKSMQQAVDIAYEIAQNGDTVLLSPCCASFDLFNSYEDRGQQFKEAVKHL